MVHAVCPLPDLLPVFFCRQPLGDPLPTHRGHEVRDPPLWGFPSLRPGLPVSWVPCSLPTTGLCLSQAQPQRHPDYHPAGGPRPGRPGGILYVPRPLQAPRTGIPAGPAHPGPGEGGGWGGLPAADTACRRAQGWTAMLPALGHPSLAVLLTLGDLQGHVGTSGHKGRAASGFLISRTRASRNSSARKGLDSFLKPGLGRRDQLPPCAAHCPPAQGCPLVCQACGVGRLHPSVLSGQ